MYEFKKNLYNLILSFFYLYLSAISILLINPSFIMKAKITFSFIILLAVLAYQPLSAAKWRVSNVPGVIANFTNLQFANDAASVLAGDTVYIEGSTVNYGDANISKKLIIVGPGFLLGENDSTQANKVPATLSSLNMNTGSEGSVVTGVSMTGTLTLTAGSIVIKRCYSNYVVTVLSSNNILLQNWLQRITCYSSSQNNLIKNNAIYSPIFEYGLYMQDGSNAVVFNNMFYSNQRICNAEYRNNISIGSVYYNNSFEVVGSCTVEKNIAASGQYTNYPNNLNNQDMNAVFVCFNDCTGFSSDERYKLLLPTSPAIGYGYGGVDCGIFGGSQPYVLSGIPSFPAIWELVVDGISVTVKAKSH
jgi:hypothetical protein